jgi:hypothetical protein
MAGGVRGNLAATDGRKPNEDPTATTLLLVAIAAVALVAGLVALKLLSPFDIVGEGDDFRPFPTDPIYKVRVVDELTIYAAKDSKPNVDVISGGILVALSTAALIAFLVLGAVGREARLRRFYVLSSAGFALLALDEFVAIHETVGYNLAPLADIPGIERPDDVLFAALLIPAVAFVYVFRDIFLSAARSRWLFGGALAAFVLAAFSDIAGLLVEEPFEIVSGVLILAGFASLIAAHISACLIPPSASPPS